MPAHSGPNTLGESNLVFAYDTGDVKNSYKGQPTVNVLSSSNVLLTSYNDHGGTHVTDTGFTLFGNATLRNTSNPAQDWNGVYLLGLSSILTPGVTYTYSFYIYFTSDNTTITYFGYGAPYFTGVKGQWNRVSTTFTATTQDHLYVTLQYSNGQPVSTYYLANLQIEAKSNPTQFVNGTRSATQGLLPLIGNSTIDLTNISFDSNAKMIWDGTDDTLGINDTITHKPNTSFTYEIVFKPLGGGTGYDKMLIGKPGDHTGIMYQNSSIFFRTRNNTPSYYTAGTYSVVQNNYYHLIATYEANSSMKFYVNGVLNGENNSVGLPLYDMGNTLCIGGSSVNYSSYVEIPVVKTYNRTLTAQEVKQNYQQYKTRFNLS